jgi:outer membrane protein OmpA-like peptidoglycan-associated protein
MKQLLLFGWFFCWVLTFSQAQNINVKRYLKDADNFMSILDFQVAQEILQDVLKADSQNLEANFKMGFCYLHSSHREKSLPYLLKVYKANPNYSPDLEGIMTAHPAYIQSLEMFLGQAYHYNNLFKEATRFYEKEKKNCLTELKNPENQKKKDIQLSLKAKIKEAEKKILECKYGEEYISSPVNTQITNIGGVINSKFSDFAPVISADENIMVFTSRREGTTGGGVDRMNGKFYEDIYISIKKDGQWTKPTNVGNPVNGKYHDASIALSPNGKQMFIYRDNNRGSGDIYTTRINPDGRWSSPKSIGDNINTEHHEPSITITSDEKTIYFSSNRPGGFGGLDIYKSEKMADGEWGPAVNLGSGINTEYDEDAPFISFNGEHLYFSSRGHSSMGDFDIFRCSWENNQWSIPQNLGFPINTADNDIYFVLSADEKTGYYASAKEGGYGEKDIYLIQMPDIQVVEIENNPDIIVETPLVKTEIVEVVDQKPRLLLKGTIRDKISKQPLEANIHLALLEDAQNFQDMTSEADNGYYSSHQVKWSDKYVISVQKEGYLFHSQSFATPKMENKNEEVIVDIELEPLKVGAKINLVIFFDFDKAHLRPESNAELKRLLKFMQNHPSVKVEIAGHTDHIGTDLKNMILSEQRAKAVVDYLLENNIAEERMIYKGYGFHQPIAPNQNQDGSDNPQGRQMNRRTECIVRVVN